MKREELSMQNVFADNIFGKKVFCGFQFYQECRFFNSFVIFYTIQLKLSDFRFEIFRCLTY